VFGVIFIALGGIIAVRPGWFADLAKGWGTDRTKHASLLSSDRASTEREALRDPLTRSMLVMFGRVAGVFFVAIGVLAVVSSLA
jgi:hypothetical protein